MAMNLQWNMLSKADTVFTSVQKREGRPVKHKEAMLIAFSDMYDLVHHEFLHQDQNMYQTVYRMVQQHLQDAVHWKQPHKWFPHTWLLHHAISP
jgi:hypothetical protein